MSFELLVKRLSPKLKGIAYRLNHNNTFFNEEDLYHEALLHLWLKFGEKKLSDKTDSYILQGCYFYLKNYIRMHKDKITPLRIDMQAADADNNLQETLVIKDEKAEHYFDYLNDKLLAEVIQNNGLTSREKELLPFFAQGFTTREIGKRLGISHVRIVKMRKIIRKKCEKYLDRF
jgi:RNA polymerase sigma factor (sigma-70 family)